ncbi:MAG: hypothetical protein ACE366_28600 [Bradymonadia bacterium]
MAQRLAVLACLTLAAWGCEEDSDGADGGVGGAGGGAAGAGGGAAGAGGAIGGAGGGIAGAGGGEAGAGGGMIVGGNGGAGGEAGAGGEPGGAGGGGGGGGGGDSITSCADLNACLSECADEACQQDCVDNSSAEAVQLFGNVATCFQNSGCDQADQACLQEACGAEIQACLGGGNMPNPVDCSQIPEGMNIGGECMDAETCGEGGACVSPDGMSNICLQVCIPGQCTDLCGDAEQCVGIAGPDGQPQTLPDGTPLGVCAEVPTGDLPNYSVCGQNAEEACMAGAACLTFAQGQPGFCAPECSQEMMGMPCADGMGACVLGLQGGNDIFCGVLCENIGSAEGCPEGLTCQDAGGGGLCLP